jgi:hypothetical protein
MKLQGGMRNIYNSLVEKPEGGDHLGNLNLEGRIILKRIFKK